MLAGGKTPDVGSRTYTQIMREQMLKGEESEVSAAGAEAAARHGSKTGCVCSTIVLKQLRKKILEKSKDGSLQRNSGGNADIGPKALAAPEPRKRGRWDQTVDEQFQPGKKQATATTPSSWADVEVSHAVCTADATN